MTSIIRRKSSLFMALGVWKEVGMGRSGLLRRRCPRAIPRGDVGDPSWAHRDDWIVLERRKRVAPLSKAHPSLARAAWAGESSVRQFGISTLASQPRGPRSVAPGP